MKINRLLPLVNIILLLTAPHFAFAGNDIESELAIEKTKHAAILKKAEALNSEVDGLKSKLVGTATSLRNTEEKISDSEEKLKSLRQKKTAYTALLYKSEASLGSMVTAAGRYKRTSTPDLLLQSTPIDAARAALVMKSMIPALNLQSDALKEQLSQINAVETAILQQESVQSQELNKINKQKSDLAALLQKRQTLYAETESARKNQEEAVNKLAKQAKNLEDLVARIQPKTKTTSSYHLPANTLLPVHGIIRTGFGETDGLGAKSKGITFGARGGATVITPLAGKVKFAGPFQKYKQILIIEHQGGYHSLIAGLDRIDTVVGASLSAGEPVGTAGSATPEALVYYELRQNGEPVNPQKMLVAQHKQS
jgi:septal ring factor EnvC (AmiA/AmiB activator)